MSVLNARYRLLATPTTIEARAEALALEQSVEMPAAAIDSAWVRAHTLGRVAAIERVDDAAWDVTLQLASVTTGAETGQLMNMLFGNCSLQEDVQLLDVELPPDLMQAFPGPRFGLAGLRARLGVQGRALTCTALKPQGLSPEELARLCASFARAGIDVIKDDHGIADQAYAPFAARVAACQRALREVAEATGHRAVYAPSLSGSPTALWGQVETALKAEVGLLLAAPMIMGLPMFQALTAEGVGCPFLAHPALSGALRIAPPLFHGKLFRLFGADAVIFPNVGGRFSYSRETCRTLVANARRPWDAVAPSLPVPAGGMHVARVSEIVAEYGVDTMLLIGGALLGAGAALEERARDFVAAVAAAAAPAAQGA
jgi:ribulose-bisphosphate carboxylase large chain